VLAPVIKMTLFMTVLLPYLAKERSRHDPVPLAPFDVLRDRSVSFV
jgi:hypothetical protein